MADASPPTSPRSRRGGGRAASCDAGDCPVCLAAYSVDAHFSQNEANSSGGGSGRGSFCREYSLVYKPTARLKIFLSYGHDRFQPIAFHLKHALQQRGHSVWVDIEKLSAGIDWEEGINGALTWVKEAQQDGRVLLLMTPHALRRPDGYCLNEIARAVQNRLSIFPVLVAASEPPPSIAMLPFFDLRDCVPTDAAQLALDAKGHPWLDVMKDHIHSGVFEEKCQRLFATLELFESMSAYGVPTVAGVENLGLFASSFDSTNPNHHHLQRGSRGSSLRRLLAQSSFDSMKSLDLGPGTPTAQDSPHAFSPNEENGAMDDSQSRTHSLDATAEPEDPSEAFKIRYMFSFDDSCYLLAKQLHDDLTAIGFSVFPPPPPPVSESVTSIQENVNAHEEALEWAAAEKNGKMILLVTPESVGRPNGVCLNDISAAMSAGIGFVPLMVRQCEIPLSICRIQWLDMSDCLIYQANTSESNSNARFVDSATLNAVRYSIRKDQLVTALKGKLDHEGQQARLFSILSPLSFQQQISKLTSRFAGREWLFTQLENWIASPTATQVFWVTGQIGSGKTALAARMVQVIPEIAAFHFALQEDEQTQNARRCVLSLAYQLTTQLPQYALFLQSREPLEEIVPVSNFATLVTRLLVEPLNEIARPQSTKPLVLLIDGLEHLSSGKNSQLMTPGAPMGRPSFARSSGSNFGDCCNSSPSGDECLVSALPSLVARLPNWVRVVLLSRLDPAIVAKLQGYTPSIVLDSLKSESQQDIKRYIENMLGESPATTLRRGIYGSASSTGASVFSNKLSPEQVDLIVKRSEGLFLYAVNIVQSIEEKRLAVDQLESLPIGMGGYFRQFFDGHFDEQQYQDSIRPVLEVLCASFEPFSLWNIVSILNWDVYDQQKIALSFGSLLSIGADGNIRPFHSSMCDWVQDPATAGKYFVNIANGHERIGLWASKEYDTVVCANRNEFVNLDFDLEASSSNTQRKTPIEALQVKARVYIVRHMIAHLTQAHGDECMILVGKYLADENFRLARRLSSLRTEGLEAFFHGEMERYPAEALLMRNPEVGSFLIRYSSNKRSYCASFIKRMELDLHSGNKVPNFAHYLIYHLQPSGAYSCVPPAEVTETTRLYPNLVSFVEEYQKKGTLKAPIPRESPLNRQISVTPDAEEPEGI